MTTYIIIYIIMGIITVTGSGHYGVIEDAGAAIAFFLFWPLVLFVMLLEGIFHLIDWIFEINN